MLDKKCCVAQDKQGDFSPIQYAGICEAAIKDIQDDKCGHDDSQMFLFHNHGGCGTIDLLPPAGGGGLFTAPSGVWTCSLVCLFSAV